MLLPLLLLPVRAQDKPAAPPPADEPNYQQPAEEDVDEKPKPKIYAFNPVQAQKELIVGNFYFKQGKFRAAALRFDEATKWNPGFAEAWLRLGAVYEAAGDSSNARRAYTRCIALGRGPGVSECRLLLHL